ncbi:MAG TPA: MlaD family protein [Methylocella sp.]|nr:MlaD family protein [Methylocella sp.]
METRASYAVIGLFTLAVIAAGFGFVMWFSGAEKPGGRTTYKIVFTGSVSGLSVGGWVLFNGVRVGEVTKIDLMPQDPSRVFALVAVDSKVPVRTDTKARLEYTGFTGVASVALSGGATDAPPLQASPHEPGVIYAERSDFQDLVESARRIAGQASDFFSKANSLLDENSGPLTATVKNIEKFSGALAAKSGEVETILSDFASLSATLDKAAEKFSKMIGNLDSFLTSGGVKGAVTDVAEAAKSIKRAADNLNAKIKTVGDNLGRFTGAGLRQYEALAADGRRTLEQINQAIRSFENNPQQLFFGRASPIPEFSGPR